MRHFIAQRGTSGPLCSIGNIWPWVAYLHAAVRTNDWHLFVVVPAAGAFYIAVFKEFVSCQQFLAAPVAMQSIDLFPGAVSPIKIMVTVRAFYCKTYSHCHTLS